MKGKGSGMRGKGKGKGKAKAAPSNPNAVPPVYRQLLSENLPALQTTPERPLKRRKTGQHDAPESVPNSAVTAQNESDDDDVEFENVLDPETFDYENETPEKRQQTAYRDTDEESESSDINWEPIDFDMKPEDDEPRGDLELTLTTKNTPQRRISTARRKAITNEEKGLRLQIHRMHLLCLLSYVERRNEWCNDPEVQKALNPHLSKKMLQFLRPKSDLSQFGQTNSLKRGLEDVVEMWRNRFTITERGMRRSLWAENDSDLQNYHLPDDADSCLDKFDFKTAAKSLKGSRDLGAQLYCALLRSAGVETRLVCSLQPLSFTAGGPSMPRGTISKPTAMTSKANAEGDMQAPNSPLATSRRSDSLPVPSPRRRLGHPNAAAYNLPSISAPVRVPPKAKPKEIHESPHPIFWLEVLDRAHQKWMPVDPLVTATVAKPLSFEPPASDRENHMSYVVAFEEEGTARDVTRRYTAAFNAKTRKVRVDSTYGGGKWWKKTMKLYSRGWKTDVEQIEDGELVSAEAREPMPKNVADFKDHPYYALERHLKRNEVLVGNSVVGKVAAGRDPAKPGQKKLENVFRRRDVKTVRSSNAWYRLGRDIKMGEQPTKTVVTKRRPEDDDDDIDPDERAGTNLYTEEQTELCNIPPIVNGQVPKNSYGNLDIFAPTMIPPGGVHIPYEEASRAARLLSIDYADALTGFKFRGQHGTAVLKGVVVAIEYREAVEAVIEGFRDERAQAEEDLRTRVALRMWKRLMVGLRIKERVDAYDIEGEELEEDLQEDDGKGMESEEYEYEGGGGFFPE